MAITILPYSTVDAGIDDGQRAAHASDDHGRQALAEVLASRDETDGVSVAYVFGFGLGVAMAWESLELVDYLPADAS